MCRAPCGAWIEIRYDSAIYKAKLKCRAPCGAWIEIMVMTGQAQPSGGVAPRVARGLKCYVRYRHLLSVRSRPVWRVD